MYVTREDDKQVRWWNLCGLVGVAAMVALEVSRPSNAGIGSVAFWLIAAAGLASVILMAPGTRVRRGNRPSQLLTER